MFSGIVETTGKIKQVDVLDDAIRLLIEPGIHFGDLKPGDSIAVNGVCLTAVEFNDRSFAVQVVPQTLRLTNLGELVEGGLVNLERSLCYNARIGGHIVQGHIDGIGRIVDINHDGPNALLVRIAIPQNLCKYTVNKGYIALDGMSITIVEAGSDYIVITLIPYTQENTVAKYYNLGTKINAEVDILGKYIEKLNANICKARK